MKITGMNVYQVDLPLKEGRYSWSNGNFVEVFDSTVLDVINLKISGVGGPDQGAPDAGFVRDTWYPDVHRRYLGW